MHTLATIAKNITFREKVNFSSDLAITNVASDSRQVTNNTLFVAVKGTQVDGHAYIEQAIEKGASAIVVEEMPTNLVDNVCYLLSDNSKEVLGLAAANFHENPSRKLQIVGITGTNGKTTCATLLHNLFTNLGYSCGLLSTVENRIGEEIVPSTHTTPDALNLQKLLKKMVDTSCTHCFMEVSSHALDQYRVAGIEFTGAVFTNISHDHLDYHHTFDEYIKAKKTLFDFLPKSAFALVNQDDKRGAVMLQNTAANKQKFAIKSMANFKGKIIENSLMGLLLEINGTEAWFKLTGTFNAYNILSIYGVGILLGEESIDLLSTLSAMEPVNGRFEKLVNSNGLTAIVDYAHTPDALKNVLETVKQINEENGLIITVVGCGGDRDNDKRPMMAQIAASYSDQVIITSDNPRNEEPKEIITQMKAGLGPQELRKTLTIEDREEAIRTACQIANNTDIILVAGKGHEQYQEIKGVKHPFDDKKVLKEMLEIN
ncbi:MAG: UDP-N-acetylmuramoyl-L-alanyl-D-glutamate--2,6-diaminopimelate ligase [Cyclobacteriaceae bacterium]